MSSDIPETEPEAVTAGDTLKFIKDLPDYPPANGWTLKYALVAEAEQITITGSDNGDGRHLVSVDKATTKTWVAKVYNWQSYVDDGTERYQIDAGTLEVRPDFLSQTAGYDARSHVKRTLDALEAMIEKRATKAQASYTIEGRTIQRMSPEELIKWHSHYSRLYDQERRAEDLRRGTGGSNRILVRF